MTTAATMDDDDVFKDHLRIVVTSVTVDWRNRHALVTIQVAGSNPSKLSGIYHRYISYPMFIEPTITWVPSLGTDGLIQESIELTSVLEIIQLFHTNSIYFFSVKLPSRQSTLTWLESQKQSIDALPPTYVSPIYGPLAYVLHINYL